MNPAERNKSKLNKAANLAADIFFAQQEVRHCRDFLRMTPRRRIWLNRQTAHRLGARVGYAYANLVLWAPLGTSPAKWLAHAVAQSGVFCGGFIDFNLKRK